MVADPCPDACDEPEEQARAVHADIAAMLARGDLASTDVNDLLALAERVVTACESLVAASDGHDEQSLLRARQRASLCAAAVLLLRHQHGIYLGELRDRLLRFWDSCR